MEFLLTLFILLQTFDGLTTYKILSKGGVELNPVLNKLFSIFGWFPSLISAKLLAVCLGIWLYVDQQMEILFVLDLMYSYVVFHNFKQMERNK